MENYKHLVQTTSLKDGRYVTRPKNQLGNCGFFPFPWTAGVGKTEDSSISEFVRNHKCKLDKLLGDIQ